MRIQRGKSILKKPIPTENLSPILEIKFENSECEKSGAPNLTNTRPETKTGYSMNPRPT
jgi:hypothetical protein